MEPDRLDRLARTVAATSPRRRVLAFLAALPVTGGLLGLPDAEESAAKGRRRRRKQRHDQRKDPGKHKPNQRQKKGCKPAGTATVCAGQCGPVSTRQTCGKTVDCGPCDCDAPCAACFVCDPTTRTCVPDPGQAGEACGSTGQVCAGDGTCACDASSCSSCQQCGGDGTCSGCDGCCDGDTCVSDCGDCRGCDGGQCRACPGCCDDSGVCQDGSTNTVCGRNNETCAACTGQEVCISGACVCQPRDCAAQGKDCGTIDDGCGGTLPCGTCANPTPVCSSNVCTACGSDGQCGSSAVCCEGSCFRGVCCADSACTRPEGPDCVAHTCVCASNGDAPCADGDACCADGCVDTETDPANCGACDFACAAGQICRGGVCGVACGSSLCVSGELCVAGTCETCTVTCTGTPAACGASLQAAFNGSDETIYVCPGTYAGGFTIARGVTVFGAGDGADEARNTILDGGGTQRVLALPESNTSLVTLEHLRVTRGAAEGGAGIYSQWVPLQLRHCTVRENHATDGGGGIFSVADLTLTACEVADNSADGGSGGGIFSVTDLTLTDCVIAANRTEGDSSNGGAIAASGIVTISHCLITDNHASFGGGLALVRSQPAVLTGQTIIRGNTARWGGGIYLDHSPMTIDAECRVTGNTATVSEFSGGGILNDESTVTLATDVIVVNNCPENCAGDPVANCQAGGTCPA